MQFNEPTFLLLFLPVLLLAYYALPPLRNSLLLIASLIFCFWGGKQTIGVLLLALAFNYALGLVVSKRRGLLIVGVTGNLLLLIWCKYAVFLNLPLPKIPSPPGLSFFTFVAIAYLVDIYRGDAQPLRHPFAAGNYFLFFSKFFAGPIVRYRDIGAQMLQREHTLDLFALGVRRFIIGLGKKVLVATTVGDVVDKIFALPQNALSADLAWLGVIAYTVQIYFDFSGYTDMAIGLGAMFGFKFPENFDYPYISTSIREFWRRWHMTLSGWLRDYLYIPLGGSRCSTWRVYFNLIFIFLVCGFWHGASWTYIVWGGLQGLFLLAERLTGNKDLPRPIGHGYALLATMVSWVFFRATSLTQATGYLGAMFGLNHVTGVADGIPAFLDPFTTLMLVVGILGAFPIIPRLKFREPVATVGYAVVLGFVLVVVAVKTYTPFIYQQF
ncbi:MAG: MBOAT family O-acyltransferase [Verrucomicrobiota bacterium]